MQYSKKGNIIGMNLEFTSIQLVKFIGGGTKEL